MASLSISMLRMVAQSVRRHGILPDEEERMNDRRAQTDRRRERSFRLTERRTGFDRRRIHAVLGALRGNDRVVAGLLIAINVMSLIDAALTVWELSLGIASEGNPVLSPLFEINPLLAVAFKLALTLGITIAIWVNRRYRAMLAATLVAFGIYVAVIAWHLGGLAGLGLV
jgi:hypothetical protein